MKFTLSFMCICFFKVIHSHDSESSEVNRVEVTPFYDTVIISDIADIINEFQNVNFPFETLVNSDSESEENIEDLLSEYQNYLDKAHNQRKTYMEKSKNKNKVPLLRHDKYAKGKTMGMHDSYYYNNLFSSNNMKFPQTPYSSPLDLIIPITSRQKYISKAPILRSKNISVDSWAFDKMVREKRPLDIQPTIINSSGREAIKSGCYCKNGQFPCKCSCKQCFIPLESLTQTRNEPKILTFNKKQEFQPDIYYGEKLPLNIEYVPDEALSDMPDNTMNVRVKVDIQMPRLQDMGKYYNYKSNGRGIELEDANSKEYMSSINLPLPYFNFPVPIDLFGHKKTPKLNKHDNVHQITIHKKKKSRFNNNKKHRKKVISFHNIKMTSAVPPTAEDNYTFSNDSQSLNNTSEIVGGNRIINVSQGMGSITTISNITDEPINKNDTQIEESLYVVVNISNKSEGEKDESHKMENSIETEFAKTININVTTEKNVLRKKREIKGQKVEIRKNETVKDVSTKSPVKNATTTKEKFENSKKTVPRSEKSVASDTGLLYWPSMKLNANRTIISAKNITTLILEGETKKTKLNITTDMIRHNRTIALEQAIFGKVDWDDVDSVVPTFISFVGKYIRGVLTFCSQTTCHSINCEEKKCIHRTCTPTERFNQKEHCTGSNTTDSEASMESIMDLPSNVVFDIVDILKDKMLGKLFGKVALCIGSKCITFVASKKNFMTSKCTVKELDKSGYCPNVKSAKVM